MPTEIISAFEKQQKVEKNVNGLFYDDALEYLVGFEWF